MTIDPRTPVLIGTGQVVQRAEGLDDARDPIALMVEAIALAASDAGLSTVPSDIMEASKVDGASPWKNYRHIIFPLLKPSLFVAAVINLINVFNSFPIIWVITMGGPGYETDTTTTLAYKISFRDQDVGQSASMAAINFAIILVFIGLFLKASKNQEQN